MIRTGMGMIVDERQRQKVEEGYKITALRLGQEHDPARLCIAATCYAYAGPFGGRAPADWPWEPETWKPKGALRNLVRAGALALAADDANIEQTGERHAAAVVVLDSCARAIDLLLEEVQADA